MSDTPKPRTSRTILREEKILFTAGTLGQEDFIYVADSALITEENLKRIDDRDNGFLFVSRLPMTYNECRYAITRAVEAKDWEEIGSISPEPVTNNRKPASYRAYETTVTLYGIIYRAVVIHSDAHDRRRRKAATKQIDQERKERLKMKKELEKIDYACLPDARAAADRIGPRVFHEITASLEERPVYHRGRPMADGTRRVKERRYGLKIEFQLHDPAVQRAREEAGCFVLLTNTLSEGTGSISAMEPLTIYKDQHMVESNFAFLKDPVFVNSLFLKCPRRIEALGLVLILALLIRRLMERTMRRNLSNKNEKVPGWNNRETSRPTSFMMTTMFVGIFVLKSKRGRHLSKPLTPVQLKYLAILEVSPDVFTQPPGHRIGSRKNE